MDVQSTKKISDHLTDLFFLFDLQPKDFFNYQKEFITEAEMLVKQEELKKAEEERSKA
jgi:hypothetical protein